MFSSLKPRHFIFLKRILCCSVLRTFCRSIKIMLVRIPLPKYDKTKFASSPRHKSVEKFALKSDQRGLNQKKIQVNLFNVFSMLIFNELCLFA